MWRHQKSITNCKNRRAVDHNAVIKRCSLNDQTAEERAGKNFSRIRRAPSTRQNGKLTSRRSVKFPVRAMFSSTIWISPAGIWALLTLRRLHQQTIYDSRLAVLVRVIFDARETKDLVHGWPAQIAVNKKHPIPLLGQRQRIVGAGKTLSFVRHRAGENETFRSASGPKRASAARKLRNASAAGLSGVSTTTR